jgi:ribonuclease P protein component
VVANNSRSEAQRTASGAFGFPNTARLRTPREFDACRSPQFRASLRWLALAACIRPAEDAPPAAVRFGLIVSKRMARKSVQRNLVKRTLREAARTNLSRLEAACHGAAHPEGRDALRCVDVVLRLKAVFPGADELPLAAFRRGLRAEAEQLLQRLATRLGATS